MDAELLSRTGEEIERLWRSVRPASGGLRQLAHALLAEASDSDSAGEFLRPASFAPRTRDELLARSLVAARATAWMAVHFAVLQSRAEWLVVAALIADAGRLRPKRGVGSSDDQTHPNVAASLAAGLADVPPSVPHTIGRHHERSDGTGFPFGLTAVRLSGDDKLLIAATRFAELVANDPADAARRLHIESRRGAFDADLTANLVWSVTGDLPVEAGFDRPAPRPWALTDRGSRLRIDPAHPALTGPHFAARTPTATVPRLAESSTRPPAPLPPFKFSRRR